MTPLDIILTWVPILGRAQVSLQQDPGADPDARAARRGRDLDGRPAPATRLALRRLDRLEGVTFTYRDEDDDAGFLLGPIDLTLRPGELVILAGGNGSGKTTLVKLLAGLYRPESGDVRLDGQPVARRGSRGLSPALLGRLRRRPSVPRPPRASTRPGSTSAAATVSSDWGWRPGLGPRGAFSTLDLSQGQRRRLALLAAWLEDRPICILDEWAANQDPSFKQIFYHELLPELRAAGKALLVISHDERLFRRRRPRHPPPGRPRPRGVAPGHRWRVGLRDSERRSTS